jgi:hypothetical protein
MQMLTATESNPEVLAEGAVSAAAADADAVYCITVCNSHVLGFLMKLRRMHYN